MPGARNDAETLAMFTPPLIHAMSVVANLIYQTNVEVVNEVVYAAGSGSGRTYDLLRAWKAKAYGGGGTAVGEFSFDPGKMDYHPSAVPGYPGVQAGLIEIVYNGLAGDFGYSTPSYHGGGYASANPLFAGSFWARPRNAWKRLVAIVGKRKIRSFFEQGMQESGLKYISHGGSIGFTSDE